MDKTLLTLALALLCTAVVAQRPCTGRYSAANTADGVNWNVEWTVSEDFQSISFTVMARTDGYVAIGFSMDRFMPNTDIIVGAVNSTGNMSYVSDRYANARAPPSVDISQDIMNATAEEVLLNGSVYTIVRFIRPVSTGDPNDLTLRGGAYVLYAWGMENNFVANDSGSIARHGGTPANRGVSREPINFLCPAPTAQPPVVPGDCTGSFAAPGTRGGVNWNAMWTVSADSRYVTFTVTAQTSGWVAIGFSLNQAMPDTDVIVGAVDVAANYSYVSDRYAFARAPPRVDEIQDILNPMAQEIIMDGNTYTMVTFTSPLDRSNTDDISLNQRLFMVYAWGTENNGNASDPMSIMIHGGTAANRGISDGPISILCEVPPPAPVPDGAATPIATALVLILAFVALIVIVV